MSTNSSSVGFSLVSCSGFLLLSSLLLLFPSPVQAEAGQDRPQNSLNFGIASGWAGTEVELPLELELLTETEIRSVVGEVRWRTDLLKFVKIRPSYLIQQQGGAVEVHLESPDLPEEEGSARLRFTISGGDRGITGGPLAYIHFEVGEDVEAGTFQVECEGKLLSLQSAQEVEVQVYGGAVSILAPGVLAACFFYMH